MSISHRHLPAIFVLGLLASLALVAHSATPNRIAAIDSRRVAIRSTVPVRASLAKDTGSAPENESLSAVTLHFNMSESQRAALTKLLADQQNPASPLYHHWLTPAEFGTRFGLSSTDLERVKSWLQSQDLNVIEVSPSMNYIAVRGSVAQINAAFGTAIHTLNEDGVTHISNLSDPTLPASLASVVSSITGLNDFKPKARARVSQVRSTAVEPKFTSSISGNHYIAPGDFHTIYDVNPLLQNSITGRGISIAVVGQTDISTADVASFRSASGLPASTPTIIQATGYLPGVSSKDIDEAHLDVEWSGAAAPGAAIKYVTVGTGSDVIAALLYAISHGVAPIITISYGGCEQVTWGQSLLNTYNSYFQQASAQGITIVGPSGDSGATDCDYQVAIATQGLAVDFPASSPYVTGAGGTMFNDGAGTYWSDANGFYQGSATGYIPEAVWNESTSSGLSAGGGGVSKYFSKPIWQIGTGVPNDSFRDVPDISLNAAASHDGYLFCSRGSCVNGYRDVSNNLNVVGGTSVASPAFAGILALLEQQLQSTGLGNVNPMIYGLANSTYYGNVFHDVTSGNNNSPCLAGSANCPSGGTIGYTANSGYDLATGWGSIDAYNFVTKWNLVTPAGSSGGSTTTTGDFSLTAPSSGATVKSGSSATVTLKVGSSNGFAGNVTLTAVGVSSTGASLASSYSFSPASPIVLSAGTSTDVTLTLNAVQTSAIETAGRSQTVVAASSPSTKHSWYGAGSGAVIACSFLVFLPHRRRWGALLTVFISIATFTAIGCGGGSSSGSSGSGSSSSSSSGSSTATNSSSLVNATAGTYTITVTGTSGTLIHTATFTLTVTN